MNPSRPDSDLSVVTGADPRRGKEAGFVSTTWFMVSVQTDKVTWPGLIRY